MTGIQRTDTPTTADERTTLEAMLDYHRATLAMKCEGLSDEQLRAPTVPPSELTLLGLVRHMAEVESGWFRGVLGAQDAKPIYYSEEDRDGEFHDLDTADTMEAFATWREQIDRAKEIAAARSLDDTGTRRGRTYSLRWIYTHMIEEYARHNGHADLIRERIDGATGE
ncbi:DinB family protein [Streptantibioticus rubrisoli]|uniref:DinB family protein n=1 Tax=Streptantibioticus rubrisoli TaxID=1387313 RepID=A0ABT1P6R7_9ACTN|nr:DinB family protein [Streptantibioticus rubrisoli]MCQ4040441.1 DinB family protein [Streptantibioticus rubrisoli]